MLEEGKGDHGHQRVSVEPLPGSASKWSRASSSFMERDVAVLAVRNLSNREIARLLAITEGTTKIHLHHMYSKLHVANREALIVLIERFFDQIPPAHRRAESRESGDQTSRKWFGTVGEISDSLQEVGKDRAIVIAARGDSEAPPESWAADNGVGADAAVP